MFFKIILICSLIFLVNAKDKSCPKLLGELANAQTLFLHCVTTHSVPVSMCMSCNEQHQNLLEAFDLLAANCSKIYFDNDRINLVASAESVLTSLWTKAYCDDCFNNNNSFVFNEKNLTFYDCLHGAKDDKNKCEKCKVQYMDLNTFYIHLDQHNNGEVCFDLQDSMNRTRNLWSKELNCCRREYNMILFTIALSLLSCVPVLFYCTTYFVTKYKEQRTSHVLFDNDPSISGQANMNNINNPPSTLNNNPSTSSSMGNNNISSVKKPPLTNTYNILNEDLDTSDDDVPINTAIVPNKAKLK